jgi:predicted ribosomally synthesized peptide with SipW-like signal peptide
VNRELRQAYGCAAIVLVACLLTIGATMAYFSSAMDTPVTESFHRFQAGQRGERTPRLPLAEVRARLQHGSAEETAEAIAILADHYRDHADTVPLLSGILRQGDPDLGPDAAAALGSIPGEASAQALAAACRNAPPSTRRAAVRALGALGTPGFRTVLEETAAAADAEALRRAAREALAAWDRRQAERFDRFRKRWTRRLEKQGESAHGPLARDLAETFSAAEAPVLLRSLAPEAELAALWLELHLILAHKTPPDLGAPLKALKVEEPWAIRRDAAEALRLVRPGWALRYLRQVLSDPEWQVRQAAMESLAALGEEGGAQVLGREAREPSVEGEREILRQRRLAIDALGAAGGRRAAEALAECLRSPALAPHKTRIERALGGMGKAAAPVVGSLLRETPGPGLLKAALQCGSAGAWQQGLARLAESQGQAAAELLPLLTLRCPEGAGADLLPFLEPPDRARAVWAATLLRFHPVPEAPAAVARALERLEARQLVITLAWIGDERAVPSLAALARQQDHPLQRRCIEVLGRIGGEGARTVLAELAGDPEVDLKSLPEARRPVVQEARQALALMEKRAALPTLATEFRGEGVISHRSVTRLPSSPEATELLLLALQRGSPRAREAAARRLEEAADPRALAELTAALLRACEATPPTEDNPVVYWLAKAVAVHGLPAGNHLHRLRHHANPLAQWAGHWGLLILNDDLPRDLRLSNPAPETPSHRAGPAAKPFALLCRLENHGGKAQAEGYLNGSDRRLADGAGWWAARHGYLVMPSVQFK